MIVNSGKIRSDRLQEILGLTEEEIKVLEQRIEIIRKALDGTLSKELQAGMKKQSKQEAMELVIKEPAQWKRALPEKDPQANHFENWENAQEKIKLLSGADVSIIELQKYVRSRLESEAT